MSDVKFTQGEWKCKEPNGKWFSEHDWTVDNDEMGSYTNVAVHSNGVVVALIVSNEDDDDTELEANANLISAAPDMYRALRDVNQAIDDANNESELADMVTSICYDISVALAKADGEQA